MTQRNTQPFVLFFSTPGGMSVQSTLINKWNIIKLKLLHSKANNQQNEKRVYKMGENICKQCNQKVVNN